MSDRDWDRLDRPRTLFETRDWLRTTQPTMPGTPLVTAEFGPDGLVSLVVWRVLDSSDPSPYFNIGGLLARLTERPPLPAGGWTLNCVGAEMYSPMLATPGVRFDAGRLRGHVSAAVATRGEPPTMCGVNFLPRTPVPGLAESLAELGFHEIRGYQQALLELPGSSYEDHVASVGRGYRSAARRDRKLFADTGQRTSVARGPAAAGDDLVRLHRNNRLKYGRPDDEEELRAFHEAMFRCLGEDILVVRSQLGNTCTGFSMFAIWGTTMHAMCTGADKHVDAIGPYFECLFYAPIEWAYQNDVRVIDYGIGAGAAKSKRGCRIVDISSWYLPGSQLPPAVGVRP